MTRNKKTSILLPPLFLTAVFVQGVADASSRAPPTPKVTSLANEAYQPTPGVEEKWVLEEEYHGASTSSKIDSKRKSAGKSRGDEKKFKSLESSAEYWWDDDENYDEDESWCGDEDDTSNASMMPQSSSIRDEAEFTASERTRGKRRNWKPWRRQSKNSSTSSIDGKTSSSYAENNQPPLLQTTDYDEEHPMRTDEWELNINLSPIYSTEEGEWFPECYADVMHKKKSGGRYRKRQVMQFARNGYVKVLEDNFQLESNPHGGRDIPLASQPPSSSVLAHSSPVNIGNRMGKQGQRIRNVMVGKWRIGHSGVAFDIPVQIIAKRKGGTGSAGEDQSKKVTVLHYHADIHLNKFGERPRMFRGVITRDRYSSFLPPNFLRPVIGTFSAEGIGIDTADTSYKERGFGLARQQALSEAAKSRQ